LLASPSFQPARPALPSSSSPFFCPPSPLRVVLLDCLSPSLYCPLPLVDRIPVDRPSAIECVDGGRLADQPPDVPPLPGVQARSVGSASLPPEGGDVASPSLPDNLAAALGSFAQKVGMDFSGPSSLWPTVVSPQSPPTESQRSPPQGTPGGPAAAAAQPPPGGHADLLATVDTPAAARALLTALQAVQELREHNLPLRELAEQVLESAAAAPDDAFSFDRRATPQHPLGATEHAAAPRRSGAAPLARAAGCHVRAASPHMVEQRLVRSAVVLGTRQLGPPGPLPDGGGAGYLAGHGSAYAGVRGGAGSSVAPAPPSRVEDERGARGAAGAEAIPAAGAGGGRQRPGPHADPAAGEQVLRAQRRRRSGLAGDVGGPRARARVAGGGHWPAQPVVGRSLPAFAIQILLLRLHPSSSSYDCLPHSLCCRAMSLVLLMKPPGSRCQL
ncbi:unnamed protein product, partial [Prorocentrum cordatum]